MLRRNWPLALLVIVFLGCRGGETADTAAPSGPAEASAQETATPVTGDWLLYNLESEPEQLNPLTSSDKYAADVLGNIFESLLTRDHKTLELKPYIAEARPTISEDKLIYTFKVRRDAHFQDGRPLTGEDVLFSVKAIKCPFVNAPFLRVYFNSVVDAQLVDPFTIKIITQERYFRNESQLGSIMVLPRHYYDPENLLAGVTVRELAQDPKKLPEQVKRFGDAFNKNYSRSPMGSGPYKFQSWQTGREIDMRRDPNYWGNGKAGIDQVYLDRIRYRIITNSDAALVTLKSGGVDFIERLTPVQAVRGTGSERFKREFGKLEYFVPGYSFIAWNNDHPIFSDKRVRQAMSYFTNRAQIAKTIYFGLAEVVEGPVYFFRPEYDKSLYRYPYDPKKAMELLTRAGWKDTDGDGVLDKVIDGRRVPFRFEFKVPSGSSTGKSVLLVLQEELKRYGIRASVRELDWTIFLDDLDNHRFDAATLAWAMPIEEPDDFQIFHSSQSVKRGSNYISYKNPRVDKILEENRREFDPEKRIQLYKDFQEILNDEQPYTFMFVRKNVSAVHRRFHGVEIYAEGLKPPLWWVPRAQQRYKDQPVMP